MGPGRARRGPRSRERAVTPGRPWGRAAPGRPALFHFRCQRPPRDPGLGGRAAAPLGRRGAPEAVTCACGVGAPGAATCAWAWSRGAGSPPPGRSRGAGCPGAVWTGLGARAGGVTGGLRISRPSRAGCGVTGPAVQGSGVWVPVNRMAQPLQAPGRWRGDAAGLGCADGRREALPHLCSHAGRGRAPRGPRSRWVPRVSLLCKGRPPPCLAPTPHL